MIPYADTNFYTRIYLEQPESTEADRLLRRGRQRASPPLPVTWLHRVEVLNAFQLHVFQAQHRGQSYVSAQQAALAHQNFRTDLDRSQFLRLAAIPDAELEKKFEELSLRRTSRHGFRTYDLLHVASALLLECDTFWGFRFEGEAFGETGGS